MNSRYSAKFAPNSDATDHYTASPRIPPRDRVPQRSATMTERIAQRFKELQIKASTSLKAGNSETSDDAAPEVDEKAHLIEPEGEDEKPLPKVDKGKGKAVDIPQILASPPPLSPPLPSARIDIARAVSPVPPPPPPPMLLAGLALPPSAVSDLLKRAAAELPLRTVKFPIIGEYKECFTGEEFATWLVDNVDGFGGSLDRAEDAARDLAERDGVLRRVGEFGNAFENNQEAFYQFRSKVQSISSVHRMSLSYVSRRLLLEHLHLLLRISSMIALHRLYLLVLPP